VLSPSLLNPILFSGILDKTEGLVDTDNDNVPDRLDLDSDNDCLGDRQEGVPNWRFANRTACGSDSPLAPLDTDGDGLFSSLLAPSLSVPLSLLIFLLISLHPPSSSLD
jgi:hypothetical protein